MNSYNQKSPYYYKCNIIPEVGKPLNGWAIRRGIQKVLCAGMVKISYIHKESETTSSV
jgi:hypothetical protein